MSVKRNGFFMFMAERRPTVEATGVELPNGWESLAELLGPEWEALPESEKKLFHRKAEEFNSFQQNYYKNLPRQRQRRRKNVMAEAEQKIVPTVEAAAPVPAQFQELDCELLVRKMFTSEEWLDKVVVICSFNLYSDPERDGVYLPAEIGLAAFSIHRGVIDNFGKLIDPVKVPMGKGAEVMRTVKKLAIPHPGKSKRAFSDVFWLARRVIAFLEKHQSYIEGTKFCVYATGPDLAVVENSFKWMKNKTSGAMSEIKVLSLPLFAYLASVSGTRPLLGLPVPSKIGPFRNLPSDPPTAILVDIYDDEEKVDKTTSHIIKRKLGEPLTTHFRYPDRFPGLKFGGFSSEEEANAYLEDTDNYKYWEVLCCMYHFKNDEGIEHCALNKVNRLAYNILEVVTMGLELNIKSWIPGSHYPDLDNPTEELDRRMQWLQFWGITKFESSMSRATPLEPAKKNEAGSSYTGRYSFYGNDKDDEARKKGQSPVQRFAERRLLPVPPEPSPITSALIRTARQTGVRVFELIAKTEINQAERADQKVDIDSGIIRRGLKE